MSDHIIIFCTTPSPDVANTLGKIIVEQKLGACVNVLPNVTSIFSWQDKLEQESECLLVIKSKQACFASLKNCIERNHPYDVPEIIALPIITGNSQYLEWIDENVSSCS